MTKQELREKLSAFQVGVLNEVKRLYRTTEVLTQVDVVKTEIFKLCMLIRVD